MKNIEKKAKGKTVDFHNSPTFENLNGEVKKSLVPFTNACVEMVSRLVKRHKLAAADQPKRTKFFVLTTVFNDPHRKLRMRG